MRGELLEQNPFHTVGIMNLHLVFDDLPDLWRLSHDEIRQEARNYARHSPINNKGYCYSPTFRPLAKNGMLAELDKTGYFQLLHGRKQLSLHPHLPAPTHHSRACHSLLVADQFAATQSSCLSKSPEQFLGRTEQDLKEVGLFDSNGTDRDMVVLAAKLGGAIAYTHDLMTVAGGERVKTLLEELKDPANEETLARQVLFPKLKGPYDCQPFTHLNRELRGVFEKYGLTDRHLDYVLSCVEGKSNTLLGRMINPSTDSLDLDQVGYTLLDFLSAGVFAPDLPKPFIPDISDEETQISLDQGLVNFKFLLEHPEQMLMRGPKPVFPWNTLDPSGDAFIDDAGELVYGNPDKILGLTLARENGFRFHYFGPMMQGIEQTLLRKVKGYIERNDGIRPEALSLPYLLSHTDTDFLTELSKIPDDDVVEIATCLLEGRVPPLFSNRYTKKPKPSDWYIKRFNLKHKTGTLVKDEGKVTTLGAYMEQNWSDLLVMQNRLIMGFEQNKVSVITPKKGGGVIMQPMLF